MSGSFTKKRLEARITLAEGGFNPGSGQSANTKVVRLGMDAEIAKPGGKEKPKCTLRIYNLPLEDMQVLTTLAFDPLAVKKNRLILMAGDDDGMSQAFTGDIISAVPRFSADAASVFEVTALTGYVASVTPTKPLTAAGSQDVATLLQGLAKQMGFAFVNRGVSVTVRNVALVGGPMEQARQLADEARIDLILDDGEMIAAPRGELRQDDAEGSTPVLKDRTGLIGFPGFDEKGVVGRCLYEPRLLLGGPVRIESIVPKASGLWRVTSVSHKLHANYGAASAWETSFKATYPNQKKSDGKKDAKKDAKK